MHQVQPTGDATRKILIEFNGEILPLTTSLPHHLRYTLPSNRELSGAAR